MQRSRAIFECLVDIRAGLDKRFNKNVGGKCGVKRRQAVGANAVNGCRTLLKMFIEITMLPFDQFDQFVDRRI